MKCLEKDRSRRYETANDLALDVQHYLRNEAVRACPPSAWYRVRKFVRRNKAALASVVGIPASLVVGLSATIVLLATHAVDMKGEHDQTKKEYNRAETALGQAKDNLERADKNLALALEALDDVYMKDVEDRILRDKRVTQAERDSLQKGLQFYERFAQQNKAHGQLERATAKADRRAGFLRLELKDWSAAQADFAKATAVFEKWADDSHGSVEDQAELARSCYGMALGLRRDGQHREAAPFCRRAISLWEKLSGDPHVPNHRVELGHCLWQLGEILSWEKQHDKAEEATREALGLFERLAAEYPKEPLYRQEVGYSQRALGDILQAAGQKDRARESYKKAILAYGSLVTEAPANSFYRQELGLTHIRLGRSLRDSQRPQKAVEAASQESAEAFRQGLTIFSKAIALDPKLAPAWNDRGFAHSELGQLDQALADFDKAIELDPKLACAWVNRGHVYNRTRRHEKAIEDLTRGIELDPKSAPAWDNRAWAYLELHDWDKALAEVSRAIDLDPKFAGAWRNRGDIYVGLRRYDKALTNYARAAELDPKLAMYRHLQAWLLATCPDATFRDAKAAVRLAKQAVELSREDPRYWRTLGAAHYRAGSWKEAVAALERSRELGRGGDAFGWYFLAMAHGQLGQKEEARRWYEKAVEWTERNDAKNEELRRFRGEAAELLGVKTKT
jgi:tetratricopeptide (TPR) repeat protein